MNEAVRRVDVRAVVTGVILIGIGVLFLLGDVHDVVRNWWPMIIILVGVAQLFDRDRLWSGVGLIVIGSWLQVVRLHLFGMTFANSWPFLLIAIGAFTSVRALFDVGKGSGREP